MAKFNEITQDSNEGLSCPVCKQRILPRTSNENTDEDDAFLEGFTEPIYCAHVMYTYFGEDIVFASKETIAAIEKCDSNDLRNALKNITITEYYLTSHLPFEENSRVGFRVD